MLQKQSIAGFVMVILFFSSSCIVSKKRYNALEQLRIQQTDSLNTIITQTKIDYNKHRNLFAASDAIKRTVIDSLEAVKQKLATDTISLGKKLRESISDYNFEISKLVSLEKELDKKSALVDSLNKDLDTKQVKLTELTKMINDNKSQVELLKNAIKNALTAFDNSELSVYIKDGKVYVAMEEKLLFKSGSSVLDKKGIDAVKKLADVLEKNTTIEILIEGHTDNIGQPELNWKLSSDRALSIVSVLVGNSKIDPKRITASGRGMYQPIADNTTAEGRQKNRRIDIILVPKLDALYKVMEN